MPRTLNFVLEAKVNAKIVLADLDAYKRLEIELTLPPSASARVAFQGRKRPSSTSWVSLRMRDKHRKDRTATTVGGKFTVSLTDWRSARFVLTSLTVPRGDGALRATLYTPQDLGLGGSDGETTPPSSPVPPAVSPSLPPLSTSPCPTLKTFMDFNGLLHPRQNAAYTYKNTKGYTSLGFSLVLPSGGTARAVFEGSSDGTSWSPLTLISESLPVSMTFCESDQELKGDISHLRAWRVRLETFNPDGSPTAPGSLFGRMEIQTLAASQAPQDLFWEASAGLHEDFDTIHIQSRILASDEERPMSTDGKVNFLETAARLWVVSSEHEDRADGSHARTLLVKGLDGDWEVQEEVVALEGTTPVQTALRYLRVRSCAVVKVGSFGVSNLGIIRVYLDRDTALSKIAVGEGMSSTSLVSVPKDWKASLMAIFLGVEEEEATTFRLYSRRSYADGSYGATRLLQAYDVYVRGSYIRHRIHLPFQPMTDIWLTVQSRRGVVQRAYGNMEVLLYK